MKIYIWTFAISLILLIKGKKIFTKVNYIRQFFVINRIKEKINKAYFAK